jgi:DNA invertase Pin-like site-specific DNA recombinase
MNIGYARVSTKEQNLDLQILDLRAKGQCEIIFSDYISGAKSERPELAKALELAKPGDSIVVWKLDRLGRSTKHLLETVEKLQSRGVEFVSLQDHIDTSTSTGKLIFTVFAAIAEFERDMIRERTLAGLQAAKAKGRIGGRPKGKSQKRIKQFVETKRMFSNGRTVHEIHEILGIPKSTLYKWKAEI